MGMQAKKIKTQYTIIIKRCLQISFSINPVLQFLYNSHARIKAAYDLGLVISNILPKNDNVAINLVTCTLAYSSCTSLWSSSAQFRSADPSFRLSEGSFVPLSLVASRRSMSGDCNVSRMADHVGLSDGLWYLGEGGGREGGSGGGREGGRESRQWRGDKEGGGGREQERGEGNG